MGWFKSAMRLMRNYLQFCWGHPGLGAAALISVAAFRALLWLTPFRRLAPHRSFEGGSVCRDAARIHRILTAVRLAAPLVPQATCLTRALAARWLLRLRGESAALCFGVDRGESAGFRAHAWLEIQGRVVLGDLPDLARFRRLTLSPATR
jgi:hypothetical protein